MTVRVVSENPVDENWIRALTFNELLELTNEFPLLKRAAWSERRAINTSIEWTMPNGEQATNYTQIVRVPYRRDLCHIEAARREFLAACEAVLATGTPARADHKQTCGGVRHYLHRDFRPGDWLRLWVLRNPQWRGQVQAPDANYITDEWLAEFSLEVRPHDER